MYAFLEKHLLSFGKFSFGKSSEYYFTIAMVTCLSSKIPFGGKKASRWGLERELFGVHLQDHMFIKCLLKELPISSDLIASL